MQFIIFVLVELESTFKIIMLGIRKKSFLYFIIEVDIYKFLKSSLKNELLPNGLFSAMHLKFDLWYQARFICASSRSSGFRYFWYSSAAACRKQ